MSTTLAAPPVLADAEWPLWTTTARLVVTDAVALAPARRLVEQRLAAVDAAASRFRADSEVCRIAYRERSGSVELSAVLADLVATALDAARRTDGDVDPTLGADLVALGYRGAPLPSRVVVHRRASHHDVVLDGRRLTVPPGVLLDLGATAKARAADLCATEVAARLGCGVLVALGGDLRVAGPAPRGGWQVLVQDGPDEPASRIELVGADAVATSSTLRRVWRHHRVPMHHIVDPVLRRPAAPVWRTVSVAAPTCVEANTLTTAAVVRGRAGRDLLRESGLPARLVDRDGHVSVLSGWPS